MGKTEYSEGGAILHAHPRDTGKASTNWAKIIANMFQKIICCMKLQLVKVTFSMFANMLVRVESFENIHNYLLLFNVIEYDFSSCFVLIKQLFYHNIGRHICLLAATLKDFS